MRGNQSQGKIKMAPAGLEPASVVFSPIYGNLPKLNAPRCGTPQRLPIPPQGQKSPSLRGVTVRGNWLPFRHRLPPRFGLLRVTLIPAGLGRY